MKEQQQLVQLLRIGCKQKVYVYRVHRLKDSSMLSVLGFKENQAFTTRYSTLLVGQVLKIKLMFNFYSLSEKIT